jgi:hypothetical protein
MHRRWLVVPLLIVLSTAALAAVAQQQPEPVGYVIGVGEVDDADIDENQPENNVLGTCHRKDGKIEVTEGMPILPGDRLETDKDHTFAIAFLDECAVTLRPGTALKVLDYGFPARDVPTHLSVEGGRAFFSIAPRPEEAHFFVKTPLGDVEVKGTKFEIISVPDGGGYKTTVAVTQGSVILRPLGKDEVQIWESGQAILTILSTNIAGFAGSEIEMKQGDIPKDQLKALQGQAVADVKVSIDKKHQVKITSWNKNSDGSYTLIKHTEINGRDLSTQTVTVTALKGGKLISKVTDKLGNLQATIVQGTLSIKEKYTAGKGSASVKDSSNKRSYKGEFKLLADGTQVVDATDKKSGARIVVTEYRDPVTGTITRTKVVFEKDATQGTQETTIIRRDGQRTSFLEIVGTTLGANGDFPTIASGGAAAASPPLQQGPPKVYTTTTVIVPDTRPVSP